MPKLKLKKPIPFSFVLDELDGIYTMVRPMFGAHAVYRDEQILLILRQKDEYREDNGVWVVTPPEHVGALDAELPSLRRILMFETAEGTKTTWNNIPESSPTFEEEVLKACALIRKRDPRIGKTPKPRKPKKRAKPTPKASESRSRPRRPARRAKRR